MDQVNYALQGVAPMYSHVSMRHVSKSCDKGFHCTTALRVFLIETLGAFLFLGEFLWTADEKSCLRLYGLKSTPSPIPFTVLLRETQNASMNPAAHSQRFTEHML